MRRENKKGVTPIIAIILLLMMTVAVAGAAFFWFIRIQGEIQGGTESYSDSLSEKMSAKVEVLAADYSQGNVTFYFQNQGNILIPISNSSQHPTTSWILQNADQNVVCSSDWSQNSSHTNCSIGCGDDLKIGEIQRVVVLLGDQCNITDNTTYPADTLFHFTVDFSGKAGTGGSFLKD